MRGSAQSHACQGMMGSPRANRKLKRPMARFSTFQQHPEGVSEGDLVDLASCRRHYHCGSKIRPTMDGRHAVHLCSHRTRSSAAAAVNTRGAEHFARARYFTFGIVVRGLSKSILDRCPNLETWAARCRRKPLRLHRDTLAHVFLPDLPVGRVRSILIGARYVKPPTPQSSHV
jgi:hypothetical protein